MKQHLQTTLLGLAILLILSCLAANADPLTPETSDIEYKTYPDVPIDPEGRKYHRFLQFPAPKGFSYDTRRIATANIDNTPEKETIVLMVANGGGDEWGQWCQAFLLITEAETDADRLPKKKDLFKLFDAGIYDFDVPGKNVVLQSPPLVIREVSSSRPWSSHISFDLVDLTGDGILDVWVKSDDGIAVISFQNDEFKTVCSAHSSFKREEPMEYIDIDDDGIYEIKIPTNISIDGVPTAAYLEWVSFYEWDGTTYVLNNKRFYAENDEFLIGILDYYNHLLLFQFGRHIPQCEAYSFYIGLVYDYRGNTAMARGYLQWVAKHAEDDDFIQAAESLLKKLPSY